jgi:hypothetical protein
MQLKHERCFVVMGVMPSDQERQHAVQRTRCESRRMPSAVVTTATCFAALGIIQPVLIFMNWTDKPTRLMTFTGMARTYCKLCMSS